MTLNRIFLCGLTLLTLLSGCSQPSSQSTDSTLSQPSPPEKPKKEYPQILELTYKICGSVKKGSEECVESKSEKGTAYKAYFFGPVTDVKLVDVTEPYHMDSVKYELAVQSKGCAMEGATPRTEAPYLSSILFFTQQTHQDREQNPLPEPKLIKWEAKPVPEKEVEGVMNPNPVFSHDNSSTLEKCIPYAGIPTRK